MFAKKEVHCIGKRHLFSSRGRFIVTFPQSEDKRLDGFLLLNVEHTVLHVERVEGYRVILLVGKVDAVLTVCPRMDKVTQSLIGISGIHQKHVGPLFIILAHHVVGEERLA